jgi:subtilisin family serine protease
MLLLGCTQVFAADYIITVDDTESVENYNLEPLIPEAGVYLTDKDTAYKLYDEGIAQSVEENTPLEIPTEPIYDDVKSENNSTLNALSTYNDTYYSEQLYYDSLKIRDYIDTYEPSGDVRIAVIDTGINRDHNEFANAKIETGGNFVTNSTDTTDYYGHGTLVTGIIAAGANNGIGIAGISPNSTIVPLVAMSKINGESVGTVASLINAMTAAVDTYDCDIINISLGVTDGYYAVDKAAQYAVKKGAIVISAAGNSGSDTDSTVASALSYPASSDGVISVGALDKSGDRAAYSQKNSRVDVVAYGGPMHLVSNAGVNTYSSVSGTSFSAPIITGMTALFISRHHVTPETYNTIIKAAATDIGDLGRGDYMGYGVPDCMAMEELYTYNQSVYISPLYVKSNGTVNFKAVSDGTVDKAQLVIAEYKNGYMTSYSISDLTFDDGYAYINLPSEPSKGSRLFIIDSLNGLKSLSEVVEY